jgi:hypothetical protein
VTQPKSKLLAERTQSSGPALARSVCGLRARLADIRLGTDQECIGTFLHKARKSRIDVAIGAGGEDFNLPPNDCSRCTRFTTVNPSPPRA